MVLHHCPFFSFFFLWVVSEINNNHQDEVAKREKLREKQTSKQKMLERLQQSNPSSSSRVVCRALPCPIITHQSPPPLRHPVPVHSCGDVLFCSFQCFFLSSFRSLPLPVHLQRDARVELSGAMTQVGEAERTLVETMIQFQRKKIEDIKVGAVCVLLCFLPWPRHRSSSSRPFSSRLVLVFLAVYCSGFWQTF